MIFTHDYRVWNTRVKIDEFRISGKNSLAHQNKLPRQILFYYVASIAVWNLIRKECSNISFWIEKSSCTSWIKHLQKQVNLFLHGTKFCLEDLFLSSKVFNEAQCYLNYPLIYCLLLKPVHWCSSNWSILKKLPLGLWRS